MFYILSQIREIALETFIQVYIVQGALFAFFLFMAYKILKRNSSQLNIILSLFYISIAVGFSMNFFFIHFYIEVIVRLLYFLTLFFLFFGTIFLMLFSAILNSKFKITPTIQNIIISSYAILLFLTFFIPNGLTINESTDWHPVYSDFFIFSLIAILSLTFIPTLFFSLSNSKMFKNKLLRKKWNFFIIGVVILYIFAYGTLLVYKITFGNILLIWSLISLVLIIFSSSLIYYGVGRDA